MPRKHVHVVSAGDRWAVVADGGHGRETFLTLEDAITDGAKKAQQRHVELLIHGRDGHIRKRSSFGSDPRNIKG
ncbi:DUF2188 domain-containing protein [Cupriavidus taiwanensis]|uniref:DUF2188 domain-containing protein n=1 Tax=Cupriavidus taiwanensis TaxID=164546 RepID=A0A375GWA6_9BURK|nr:DUF2188 domain-containing protein [Cupriavidus taiwanensis]SOY43441.1 conserved hypothetical protein [Cupriavidus taiwanensis]SOY45923.1 conserved hypothetical protein [Cupriavidus taiwanensis]SOY81380.1 conserved hypothetical protein [Cupriavidus taiwanensis]SOZ22659.1 conserved hypothetical protein [Cupriavidus taiwanensis]SOZ54436.1 conserved hypothetical protein [Cupriavidus taiwanensis]